MGGKSSKNKKKKESAKEKIVEGGPVKHREATQNRVSEDEMQCAEVKSRINKI